MVIKGTWALVPKGELNWRALTSKCTYNYDNGKQVQEVFDAGKYWQCPREVFSDTQLEKLRIPILRLEPTFRAAFGSATKTISPEGASSELAQRIQAQAIDVLIETKNGVIQVQPGIGKTALGLQLAQTWGVPTLVSVHTGDLQRQWVDRATELMGLPRERIGLIGGAAKKWDYEGKDLVVALIHSLSKNPERALPLMLEFGLCIYDEVHHMQGFQFRNALTVCSGTRIGLSATPLVRGLERIYFNHIGPIVFKNEETDLEPTVFFVEAKAHLTQKAVGRIIAKTAACGDDTRRAWTMNEVGTSQINEVIAATVRECAKQGRKQILLSDRVAQLKILHRKLDGSSLLIGDTKEDSRKDALEKSDIVCASCVPGTEGLDRKDLDTLHICLPQAGSNRFVQGIGRILRFKEGKLDPHVFAYDPVDVPLLHKTFKKFRGNTYRYKYRRKTIDKTGS